MMMPANYSAVAEEEMSYVAGGGLATFGSSVWTIIGNSYMKTFVGELIGTMFSGNYAIGDALGNVGATIYPEGATVLGGLMGTVGLVAAADQLASYDAKNVTKKKLFSIKKKPGTMIINDYEGGADANQLTFTEAFNDYRKFLLTVGIKY